MTDSVLFNSILIRNIKDVNFSAFLSHVNDSQDKKHIHLLAASSIVAAIDDKYLASIFSSGFSLCDSAPLAKIIRLSIPNFDQIRGSDFLRQIIKHDTGKVNHFFIVSNSKIYESIRRYALQVNEHFKICGGIIPEFTDDFSEFYINWASKIKQASADYIWIGLGSPKQDRIAYELSELTGKLCIAIGAAIEFVSGEKKEAPKIIQLLYLEWLFRLASDPRRLIKRYTLENIIFIWLVIKHLFRKWIKI